ncbi:MAG: hypothetical protein U0105_00340 [Candidatus Obscuribacterales bacterium]
MHFKQLTLAGLTAITVLTFSPDAPLYSKSAKRASIQYGPGILYCCKSVFFGTRGVDKPLKVNAEDPQFRPVIAWIGKNVFSTLNSESVPRKKNKRAETQYALTLWNREMPVAHYPGPGLGDSIMLTIPLNEETLGWDYRDKVAGLRKIMMHDSKD